MIRFAAILGTSLILIGCQAERWGPYSSPRVSGQVVAADTRKPLAGVLVDRDGSERQPKAQKGGELMIRKMPLLTNKKGEFVFESERVLSVYRGTGWNQVGLRFEKPGYLPLRTNYSMSFDTNSPTSDDSLSIGQVLLQPARK